MPNLTRATTTAAALIALLLLAACGGDDGDGDSGSIVVWTGDTIPDRVAATEEIIAAFTADTGIEVELVGVEEDQFNQRPRRSACGRARGSSTRRRSAATR